jgi:predicted HTH transcriptional regulator
MKELPSIGFPLPTFEMQSGNVVVSFARNSATTGTAGMSVREYKELLYIQAYEPVTRVQFAKHFKLPDRTAKAHLESLVSSGKIEPVGRGKTTKYVSRKR